MTFTYDWQSCDAQGNDCFDADTPDGQTHVVVADEVDGTLRVLVTATNASGSATALSAPTPLITDTATIANATPPVITGSPTVGQTMTTSDGTWLGTPAPTFTYAWETCDATGANCVTVPGATKNTLKIDGTMIGKTVKSKVTATNSNGTASAESDPSAVIGTSAATAPVSSSPPTITGTPKAGQTLTAGPGTWTGAAPFTYTYSWERCSSKGTGCTAISGATKQTYVVTTADNGKTLKVKVTAKNSIGSASATSDATVPVGSNAQPTPPPPPTPPPVSGADRLLLPDGKFSIPIADVAAPDKLVVAVVEVPARARPKARLVATVRVTDSHGDVVRGAMVEIHASPRAALAKVAQSPTDVGGYADLLLRTTSRVGTMQLFVRARTGAKAKEALVSAAKRVKVAVAPAKTR
jgi:hypothetical protein